MKYRELTAKEREAYEIGYKVGNRKTIITDIEWESESEKKIYRKGYMAGLMDLKRTQNKVSKINNVSNVSKVNNVNSYNNINNNNINFRDSNRDGGVGEEKEKEIKKEKIKQLITQTAKSMKRQPDHILITENNITMKREFGEFIKQNFETKTITQVKNWMIQNAQGQQWKPERLLKLLCKWTGKNTSDLTIKWMNQISQK